MTPLATFRVALHSLGTDNLRAGLTLLGIVIGVAAVISLVAIGRGVQQSITESLQSLGTNLLFVRPGETSQSGVFGGQGSAATLTLDDAYALLDPVFAPSVGKCGTGVEHLWPGGCREKQHLYSSSWCDARVSVRQELSRCQWPVHYPGSGGEQLPGGGVGSNHL